MVDILNYLPNAMKEFKEFQVLSEAENPEITSLWGVMDDVIKDQFLVDATENGVGRWETNLKITPKGTDTLDIRKFRLNTRLNEQLPYTFTTLEQNLIALCGDNGYILELNNGTYTLTVRVELIVKGKYDEVKALINRMIPANIVIDLSLRYNQHSTLANFKHSKLANYTYDQIRNEVIS